MILSRDEGLSNYEVGLLYNYVVNNEIIVALQQRKVTKLLEDQGVVYLGLFGSQSRNEARADSDIDLLVDFAETKSLFELARIKLSLEEMLGGKVDLSLKNQLKPALRQFVYNDLVTVYEQN